jgi:hypothetical protein
MTFWDRFKNYFYKRQLTETLSQAKAIRAITNLQDAKSIGILYDSTNPDNDAVISKFAAMLRSKGKTVELLAFLDDKKVEHKEGIALFNKKNLSWTGVPDDEKAQSFAAQPFDLLLGCFVEANPALEYIACTSKAKWRVGVYAAGKTECYDMMVNMSGHNDLQYLLDQAQHFLNEIKYA